MTCHSTVSSIAEIVRGLCHILIELEYDIVDLKNLFYINKLQLNILSTVISLICTNY